MLEEKNLQGPEGDLAVEKALAKPENFVLKPQREGGGEYLPSFVVFFFGGGGGGGRFVNFSPRLPALSLLLISTLREQLL